MPASPDKTIDRQRGVRRRALRPAAARRRRGHEQRHRALPGVGARRRRRRCRHGSARECAYAARPTATSQVRPRDGRATVTLSESTDPTSCTRIRRRAFNRTDRTASLKSSTRPRFAWTDAAWEGVPLAGQVLYELHRHVHAARNMDGRSRRTCRSWPHLGITVIEVMPVAEFEGRFGWGYDGVDLFAPSHLYGAPDDFRRVRRSRRTARASASSSTSSTTTSVRSATTCAPFARPTSPIATRTSGATRSISTATTPGRCASSSSPTPATGSTSFTSTACGSTRRSRSSTDRRRTCWSRSAERVREKAARPPDDHRRRERAAGYPAGAAGRAWRIRARRPVERRLPSQRDGGADRARRGVLQRHAGASRRSSSRRPSTAICSRDSTTTGSGSRAARRRWTCRRPRFVVFLQNHDQVANSGARAARPHADKPGEWRAMTALLLLMPGTPMLFQGPGVRGLQRRSCTSPTSTPTWPRRCEKGRAEFLSQFPSIVDYARRHGLDDPGDRADVRALQARFRRTRDATKRIYALHRDLLRLRRETAAFRASAPGRRRRCGADRGGIRASVL